MLVVAEVVARDGDAEADRVDEAEPDAEAAVDDEAEPDEEAEPGEDEADFGVVEWEVGLGDAE